MTSPSVVECKKPVPTLERVTLYLAAVAIFLALLSSYLLPFLSTPIGIFEVALIIIVIGLLAHGIYVIYANRMIGRQTEVLGLIRKRILELKADRLVDDPSRPMTSAELLLYFPTSCHPYVKHVLSESD